jgi:hypothetical protein
VVQLAGVILSHNNKKIQPDSWCQEKYVGISTY